MTTERSHGSLLTPEDLARIGHLELEARRPMIGTVAGKHQSPHRGTSVEFAEYREYVPGDDLRRLDWRVYGRSDRFFVKEFQADTNLRLFVVVDASGSMRYRAPKDSKLRGSTTGDGPTKFEVASRIAGLLAYVALRQGDAAGLSLAAEAGVLTGPAHVPPQRRGSHFQTLERLLLGTRPSGPTRLAATLHELAERTTQRAQIVVLSDLFVPLPPLEDALQHLRFEKHDVALFQLLDRREVEFDFDRTTRFVDLEGGAPLVVEPSLLGARYRAAFEQHQTDLGGMVDRAGVELLRTLLDQPAAEVVVQFLLARAARRGRR
jgi:uncharacterized protein (DUF58 family)